MKYKAIALDLDGTLKSSNREILPKTKEILLTLGKKGVVIILASGRPTHGMQKEAQELQLDRWGGYVLSFNGACVVNEKNKEVLYEKVFTKELAKAVYDKAKEHQLGVLTYHDDCVLTEDTEDEYVQYEASLNDMKLEKVMHFKEDIPTFVNKILVTGKPTHVAEILEDVMQPFSSTLSIYRSAPFFIEVMDKGIDKAASLAVLLQSLGIKKEELVAFGDGYNDLSMLSYAGLGVAMENAVAEVKEKADYITASNDDEGIAKCLLQLQEKGEI